MGIPVYTSNIISHLNKQKNQPLFKAGFATRLHECLHHLESDQIHIRF